MATKKSSEPQVILTEGYAGSYEEQEDTAGVAPLVQLHEGGFNGNQIKFLVYGDSGAGKTRFSATWPNPIFLDIDHGMSSIDFPVHHIDIQSWRDLQSAYEFLTHAEHEFETVVLDSLNEAQYAAMRSVISDFPSIKRPYDDLPSQSDYGKMLDDFEKLVRELKALPMNVVFICNAANRVYETDPVQPQLTGKNTPNNICRMMDVIGYIYRGESSDRVKPRYMVFDAVNYVTKDRSGKLPTTVENPTYQELLRYWIG